MTTTNSWQEQGVKEVSTNPQKEQNVFNDSNNKYSKAVMSHFIEVTEAKK